VGTGRTCSAKCIGDLVGSTSEPDVPDTGRDPRESS